jgi:ribosomal protein L36
MASAWSDSPWKRFFLVIFYEEDTAFLSKISVIFLAINSDFSSRMSSVKEVCKRSFFVKTREGHIYVIAVERNPFLLRRFLHFLPLTLRSGVIERENLYNLYKIHWSRRLIRFFVIQLWSQIITIFKINLVTIFEGKTTCRHRMTPKNRFSIKSMILLSNFFQNFFITR